MFGFGRPNLSQRMRNVRGLGASRSSMTEGAQKLQNSITGMRGKLKSTGKVGSGLTDQELLDVVNDENRMAGNLANAAGLAALIPGLGKPIAGLLGLGALGLTGYTMFGPEATRRSILDVGKDDDDQFRKGPVARVLDAIDGESNYFRLDDASLEKGLRKRINKDIRGSAAYQTAQGFPGIDLTIRDDDTVESFGRRIQPQLLREGQKFEYNSPLNVDIREREATQRAFNNNLLQMQMKESFDLKRDTLQERIDARVGDQNLLNMQLLQSQRQFDQNLAYMTEESRRDRTANLIGALSNLGAAFVI